MTLPESSGSHGRRTPLVFGALRIRRFRRLLVTGMMAVVTSCGGDGGGGSGISVVTGAATPAPTPTPAPIPTPTPTPTPVAFDPTILRIFCRPLRTPDLVVAGKGWQNDYLPNPPYTASEARDADDFTVAYDRAAGGYRLMLPLLGSGLLYQTGGARDIGEGFGPSVPAALAEDVAAARGKTPVSALKSGATGDRYAYVSWVAWYANSPASGGIHTQSLGVVGVAQPTAPKEMPVAGKSAFSGHLLGYMAGNGGDYLTGATDLSVDYAGSIAGTIDFKLICFMGCSYPATAYRLANVTYASGNTGFTADLLTDGAPSSGRISGFFAGPDARELLIRFEAPFYNPDQKRWTRSGGVVLARVR